MGSGGLSCGAACMKYLLFIFNIFFFICGAALLAIGIILLVDDDINKYLEVISWDSSDPLMHAAAVVFIAVGAFIFVVGFLGCCGAWNEHACMLCMYCSLMVFVMICEIGAAVLGIVFRTQLNYEVKAFMRSTAEENVTAEYLQPDPITAAWHHMQVKLRCCGGSGYKDYRANKHFNDFIPVPMTCCVLVNSDPTNPVPVDVNKCYIEAKTDSGQSKFLYEGGCFTSVTEWLDEYAGIIIGVGFAIAFIQILGILFACCIRKEILKQSEVA